MASIKILSFHHASVRGTVHPMASSETRWIVTANFTADGSVAYRRADGSWSSHFADAEVFSTEDETTPLVSHSAKFEQRLVSDPYGIDVGFGPSGVFPNTARERIRAEGPTVPIRRPDAGLRTPKQV